MDYVIPPMPETVTGIDSYRKRLQMLEGPYEIDLRLKVDQSCLRAREAMATAETGMEEVEVKIQTSQTLAPTSERTAHEEVMVLGE